jgi:putative MFS transporter
VVAAAEQTARETIGEELPQPEPVPDEAPAERFPIRALLRPPMVGPLALFVGIWFVYYIGNYGWLTLAPTLFVDKGYSLAASTTYLIVSGIGFPVGPSRHHAFQRASSASSPPPRSPWPEGSRC